MTLSDQLTAALRLECAVADGTVELQRGAGPGGVDLYVDRISDSLSHSTRDRELRYSGASLMNVMPVRPQAGDLRPEERSGPQSSADNRAGGKPQPVNAGGLRRGAESGSGSQKYNSRPPRTPLRPPVKGKP